MSIRSNAYSLSCALLASCLLAPAWANTTDARLPTPQDFLHNARQAYYNLPREGVIGFKCRLTVDWPHFLSDAKMFRSKDTINQYASYLDRVKMEVHVDRYGQASLSHNDTLAVTPIMRKSLTYMYSVVEMMVRTNFQSWSLYTIGFPMPNLSEDAHLENLGETYRMHFRDFNGAEWNGIFRKDYALTKIYSSNQKTGRRADSSPRFMHTPKGWLFVSRESSFVEPTKSGTGTLTIEYQEVDGVQLPKTINTTGTNKYTAPITKPDVAFDSRLKFDQCSITREKEK